MADVDAAVTDTHALLYHAAASARLGRRAAAHFERAEARLAIVYVPAAVMWEVALLARGGRASLRRAPRDFFADLFSNPAYQPVRPHARADLRRRRSALQSRSRSTR